MNPSKQPIEGAIVSLVRAQQSLYKALQDKYSGLDQLLIGSPRFGNLAAMDLYWEFTRHGRGFRFEAVPDKTVVDILVYTPEATDCFDALRLAEYAESIGIDELFYKDVSASVSSEKGVEEILRSMVDSGFLGIYPRSDLYCLKNETNRGKPHACY